MDELLLNLDAFLFAVSVVEISMVRKVSSLRSDLLAAAREG